MVKNIKTGTSYLSIDLTEIKAINVYAGMINSSTFMILEKSLHFSDQRYAKHCPAKTSYSHGCSVRNIRAALL